MEEKFSQVCFYSRHGVTETILVRGKKYLNGFVGSVPYLRDFVGRVGIFTKQNGRGGAKFKVEFALGDLVKVTRPV